MMTTKAKTKTTEPKPCPISRQDFLAHAKPLMIEVDGASRLVASPKEFSTGSFGWFAGDKVVITINGVPVKVQVGLNMTVVDSKTVKAK